MGVIERKLQIEREHASLLATINKSIGTVTKKDFEQMVGKLTDMEVEYRGIVEKQVYGDNPSVEDILAVHDFPVIGHQTKTNKDGQVVSIDPITRTAKVNLKAFCEFHQYDLSWFYEMQALNKRLTLRVAESIGVPAAKMAEIENSYYLHKLAKDIELGKTPTSNTQVISHLQKVFDMLCPDTGKKVNNRDLAFIMCCYTKKGREALAVACSKHNALMGILLDVFHRIVTGKVYDANYKMVRKPAEPVVVSVEKVDPEKPVKKAKSKKADKPAEDKAVAPAA